MYSPIFNKNVWPYVLCPTVIIVGGQNTVLQSPETILACYDQYCFSIISHYYVPTRTIFGSLTYSVVCQQVAYQLVALWDIGDTGTPRFVELCCDQIMEDSDRFDDLPLEVTNVSYRT